MNKIKIIKIIKSSIVILTLFVFITPVIASKIAISYPSDLKNTQIPVGGEKVLNISIHNNEDYEILAEISHDGFKNINIKHSESILISKNTVKKVPIHLSSTTSCSFSGTVHILFKTKNNSNNGNEIISGSGILIEGKAKGGHALTVDIIPSESGTVEISPPGKAFLKGATVTLTAKPNSQYSFDHWTGDISENNPIVTLEMNSNKTVNAHFEKKSNPSPSVTFSYAPSNPESGELIKFQAFEIENTNSIISYSWNFDDGSSGVGETITHAYSPGKYSVKLTAKYESGETKSISKTITIEPKTTLLSKFSLLFLLTSIGIILTGVIVWRKKQRF